MNSKFFNNSDDNTLFAKFSGIAEGMGAAFHSFLAVSGYFRSSGYFKLREKLGNVRKIQILVGINIDNVFRRHDKSELWFGNPEQAKQIYTQSFIDDIRDANYANEIEHGILQFIDDVKCGRLEMRIHASKTLHAKFYLCLPENHTEHSDGWVIMGSSNLTDAGLGLIRAPQYELNVAMKDYNDVAYCKSEFDKLWEEGVPLSPDDIAAPFAKTHLGIQPTPFELYMKVLIDTFGEQVEDSFSLSLPEGFKDFSYQRDAVIQGYQMLCRHNGFFLADVVGLGKTVVAAMIARRFVEANGRQTKILVVYPIAVEENWKETFKSFSLTRHTQFISNGSLPKLLEERGHYHAKEEFDLIIVDESHNFRHNNSERFNDLQKICKAPRRHHGNLGETHGSRKKVMLLSATAINNEPDDIRWQILLFQDSARPTIENIQNINEFFAPLSKRYKDAMRRRHDSEKFDIQKIDLIYEKIRRDLLERITVRRTRQNILKSTDYKADLDKQGIVFPIVSKPEILNYKLMPELEILLLKTLWFLTGDANYQDMLEAFGNPLPSDAVPIYYARYRAIEFLKPEFKNRYEKADQVAAALHKLYRTLMVKRLESSFPAFRCSIANALRGIKQILAMFAADKVFIVRNIDIRNWLDKGMEFDAIIDKLIDERGYEKEGFLYKAEDFNPDFITMLRADKDVFEALEKQWETVNVDPKLDVFIDALQKRLLHKTINPSGKLVVFSESLDTAKYLEEQLKTKLNREDILCVYSENRNRLKDKIRTSFDANIAADKQGDQYNILLSTDVLSEGINLHRSNVVIHYDTPWNVAHLMQRIGRVNRIGSTAAAIHNFMFYPSDQGNREISLYENALIKMQGFQSALGEDVQIFSHEEIVKQFELFNSEVKDDVDESLLLLREVREFFHKHREDYERIKNFPVKVRCIRKEVSNSVTKQEGNFSLAFIKAAGRIQFYIVSNAKPEPVSFLEAVKYLRAEVNEKSLPFSFASKTHYKDIAAALAAFQDGDTGGGLHGNQAVTVAPASKDRASRAAASVLRASLRYVKGGQLPAQLAPQIDALINDLDAGIHTQLPKKLNAAVKKLGEFAAHPTEAQIAALPGILSALYDEFAPRKVVAVPETEREAADTVIVVSETFTVASRSRNGIELERDVPATL
ncbi:MAG: phospholipase D-like domain-containing protein [Zoogloeaceae bacterium]|jgi:superfamily II DNA or RNA helicase|nr:phospholipase D-like domain-containing protein [Zoogloeaceae bacterium]